MVIANKYRYYQEQVRKKKFAKKNNGESIDVDKVLYLTKEFVEKTPEGDFPYAVVLKTGHIKQLSQRLYEQVYAVLHKPSELSPPVGEPLREIVGEAWESKEGG